MSKNGPKASYEAELAKTRVKLQEKYGVTDSPPSLDGISSSPIDQAKLKLEGLKQMRENFGKELQTSLDRLNKEWADIQATVNTKISAVDREIVKTEGVLEFFENLGSTGGPADA